MRYFKTITLIGALSLVLAACTSGGSSCANRKGMCYEISISGTGMEISVGEEKPFSLFTSLYNDGRPIYTRARTNARDVTLTVGNRNVLQVEVRGDAEMNGARMIGLAPGRSTLHARLKDHPRAWDEVIIDVR